MFDWQTDPLFASLQDLSVQPGCADGQLGVRHQVRLSSLATVSTWVSI